MSNTLLSLGLYISIQKIAQYCLDRVKNKYYRDNLLKEIQNGDHLRSWKIEDKSNRIVIRSDDERQAYILEFDIDIKNRIVNTCMIYSDNPLLSKKIRMSKSKMSEMVENIRTTKNMSDEVSDIMLELTDSGFNCETKYCMFSKTIFISIRKDGNREFKYSDIKEDIEGIIKRCEYIGLSLLHNSGVNGRSARINSLLGDYIPIDKFSISFKHNRQSITS